MWIILAIHASDPTALGLLMTWLNVGAKIAPLLDLVKIKIVASGLMLT
jgi:hypothetical protein